MKKSLIALFLVAAVALLCAACEDIAGGAEDSEGVSISIFNSKYEIQDAFEDLAEEYSAQTGVNVDVYYSQDTVAAHLATRYSSNAPYTIAMVDPKDVYLLAREHAADLSDQAWVEDTDYEISVDGKVYGFPVCVESRGILYNADAIEAITGEPFDPQAYATVDAFEELLEELKAGGMERPTAIIKEDWSLGAHFLAEVYEEQPDTDAFIQSLHDGTADLANNDIWNAKMDCFDVLAKYNYAWDAPIVAEREVSEQKLAEGEIAFMFGGNWDWSMIKEYEYTENMGIMPLPQETDDGANEKLVGGGTKFFLIDSSENTSEEQRQAAKDFLNWLVFDAKGNAFLTEKCNLVPAFTSVKAENLDPLSASVKKYADAGMMIPSYDHLPDDHLSICGAFMQKYLALETDRDGLAADIEDYWSSAVPVVY